MARTPSTAPPSNTSSTRACGLPPLFPAGDHREGAAINKNVYGGTIGGPIVRNKLFYFFSAELEHRGTKDASGLTWRRRELERHHRPEFPGRRRRLRTGDFSTSGTVIYDPLTGTATGTGRIPFAFRTAPA